jgi:GNAT superfamily N-acetyltransferase
MGEIGKPVNASRRLLVLRSRHFARKQTQVTAKLRFRAVTRAHLKDLACFSERHGRFSYCSCMRWRLRSGEFARSTKAHRVYALNRLVRDGVPVGVLAFLGKAPVGWCSIAPRETYAALERYRALPRLDDKPVWAVVCFFVDRQVRRQGATRALLEAAVKYARASGARIIEGYPVEPGPRSYTYMGSPSTYRAAGFRDVTPSGQVRKVMRFFARK